MKAPKTRHTGVPITRARAYSNARKMTDLYRKAIARQRRWDKRRAELWEGEVRATAHGEPADA